VTTTWPIDLHFPDPQNSKDFPDAEFRSISKMHAVKPYAIPYRSLYSRNIDNLMMAGRNISVTHVALGTVRVQRTTGMMGEVVGMAASLCKKYDTSPRGVYKDYLDELKSLMATGVGKKKEAMNRLTEISYMSSADNTLQPAMFLKASTNAPAPLLVALHSWSYGYRQESFINEYVKFCTANNWTLIHPDFRGKNDNPDACGSELVIKDIVSAVEYAKSKACVDEKRIYLVGASGGGHAALLMAARCPELWTAVSAWVPISDLKQWYFQTKQRNVSYYKSLEKICGGAPTFSPEVDRQYAMRSFLSYPKVKYDFKIDINAGIHDGHTGSVPISHSLNAFNMLADPKDRISQADIEYFVKNQAVPPQLVQNISDNSYKNKKPLFRKESNNARVTIFEGSHEIIESAACDWLAKQSK
jgi:pimeloyl-ACP methyl ester carboxylesterase